MAVTADPSASSAPSALPGVVEQLYIHMEQQKEAAVRLYRKAGFKQQEEEGVEVARRTWRPPRLSSLHIALKSVRHL